MIDGMELIGVAGLVAGVTGIILAVRSGHKLNRALDYLHNEYGLKIKGHAQFGPMDSTAKVDKRPVDTEKTQLTRMATPPFRHCRI